MNTIKLSATLMFAASMTWAGVANAEEPCGAPVETFNNCEVVQAPDCFEACQVDAMIVSCVAQNAERCIDDCASPEVSSCDATCEQECANTCAAEVVKPAPQECRIVCGSSCMGDCSAGCAVADNKTLCYSACNQQCSAHCDATCLAPQKELGIDQDIDEYAENWGGRRGYGWGHPGRRGRGHGWGWGSGRGRGHGWGHPGRRGRGHGWGGPGRRGRGHGWGHPGRRGGWGWDEGSAFEPLIDSIPTQAEQAGGVDEVLNLCQASCQQSCGGACTANITRDCELGCQVDFAGECAPQMSNTCLDACGQGAVLMCDGQYIQPTDVDACIAALEHEGVEVGGPITALNSEVLLATALEGASCSVADKSNDLRFAGVLFGLFGLGLGASLVRRRRAA